MRNYATLANAIRAMDEELNILRDASNHWRATFDKQLAERDAEVHTTLERLAASQREAIALRTAAQQALEALRTIWAGTLPDEEADAVESAANALTAALESK